MSLHQHHTAEDIEVLREMIRVAEKRRDEELQMIERINQYNLALIGFSGSFLSLLVTVKFPIIVVIVAGALLLVSLTVSLATIRPRVLKGGAIDLRYDIDQAKDGKISSLYYYLLETADVIQEAATKAGQRSYEKKNGTIFSALFLVLALAATYTLYIIYA